MIRIYDGNNYARRYAEKAHSGDIIRDLYIETYYHPDVVIWVWDGENSLASRREIYPKYKAQRKPGDPGIYASLEFLKKALRLSKAIQIEVPGYEADDVIAKLAIKYRRGGVHIHSADRDFCQIDGITMDAVAPEQPEWVRLYKTLVGDPVDNIPGMKGFGEISWAKFPPGDRAAMEAFLKGNRVPEVLNLPPACYKWFAQSKNQELLRAFYKIIGFLPVPDELVEQHTIVGVPRRDLMEPVFEEFLMAAA